MHPEARAFVQRAVLDHGPFAKTAEFGARDINGGVRDLFTAGDYLGLDITPGAGVDQVVDVLDWTGKGFDCVVCCEMLEHVPDGKAIIAAAAKALKRGGTLILTCATDPRAPHSAVDGADLRDGEHYGNVSQRQLQAWLTAVGLKGTIERHPGRGDLYCVATK